MKKLVCLLVVAVAATSLAQQGGRGQRGAGRNQMTVISLLQRSDVQTELKLSDDQKSKLGELQPQRGAAGGGARRQNGAGGGAAGAAQQADPAAMRAAMAEREAKFMAILSSDQQKRLKELFVQRAGARAIVREEIAKELGLTEKQTAKVRELIAKQREANVAVMEKVRTGELERTAVRELNAKNEAILMEEMKKVLTPEQAAKLTAMGGAPFKFDEEAGN